MFDRLLFPLGLFVCLFLAPYGGAQGKENYLNLEAGENEALAIAKVRNLGGSGAPTYSPYLLVANTVDDSIEVFDAVTETFLARVAVGQSPIGIYVKPTEVMLDIQTYAVSSGGTTWTLAYSVNWAGDSLTLIGLHHVTVGGVQTLEARALRTVYVGDEPTALDFRPVVSGVAETQPGTPNHEDLVVTHGTLAFWDVRDPVTLEPFANSSMTWQALELLETPATSGGASPRAVKEAWEVKYLPTRTGVAPKMVVLNRRGGNYTHAPAVVQSNYVQIPSNPYYGLAAPFDVVNKSPEYDFDLFGPVQPNATLSAAPTGGRIGELGSTNFAMGVAPNGDLFVVGQLARNNDQSVFGSPNPIHHTGEALHRNMEMTSTGFAQSMIWRVTNLGGTAAIEALDLNGGTTAPKITQPTGIAFLGTSTSFKIFVTGFNSDSLAEINFTTSLTAATVTRADLRVTSGAFPNYAGGALTGRMMGPRSVTVFNEPGFTQKLFVLNKIDRSIWSLNPNALPATTAGLTPISIPHDPRPRYIKQGQPFLYSSALSGNGTSSCATCHVDAHTDGLAWTLTGAPAPTVLLGAFSNGAVKGPMFTQSLRGLPTFEVGSFGVSGASGTASNPGQRLFTTEPLHWRGDKGFFEDFNAAFVNLLGMNSTAMPWVVDALSFPSLNNADLHEGLPRGDMDRFRDFIFSVHYPPNPEQPLDRRYSGGISAAAAGASLEPAPIVASIASSYGGQRGIELFLDSGAAEGSCVNCHAFPFGTDQIQTESFSNSLDPSEPANRIETAALRGLFSKEKRLSRLIPLTPPAGATMPDRGILDIGAAPGGPVTFPGLSPLSEGAVTGEFGLTHTGNNLELVPGTTVTLGNASETTRHFTHGFVFGSAAERDALTVYQRELDTGVAPGLGFTVLVDPHTLANPVYGPFWIVLASLMQDQAKLANLGLVARARIAGVDRGFRYDPVADQYVEIAFAPATATPLGPQSLAALFANVSVSQTNDNSIVFIATPLGSEDRFANIVDGKTAPTVTTSGSASSITLQPMVPMRANIRIPEFLRPITTIPVEPRSFSSTPSELGPQPNITMDYLWATLAFVNPSGPLFGVKGTLNHMPSRRFAVSGTNILPGAKLRLYFPLSADVATATPPSGSTGWLPPTTTASAATHEWIEFPIYARNNGTSTDFESAVELDPMNVYAMLMGGPNSVGSLYFGGAATYGLALNRTSTFATPFFYNTPFFTNVVANQPPTTPAGLLNGVNCMNEWLAELPFLQSVATLYGPERWNWYYVQIINTIRTTSTATPTTVTSSGGWQRLTM